MYSHQPKGYKCPYCLLTQKEETEYNKIKDVFFEDNKSLGFISPKWWPNNPGSVILIPKKHFENIYDISDSLLSSLYVNSKKIAIALKDIYKCDGVSIRQHNEPAGNQDIFHFHLNILPRYKDDKLYQRHDESRFVSIKERQLYAKKLKKYFSLQK